MIEKHNEHCKEIADRLDAIAYGNILVCPDCGEWIEACTENDATTPDGFEGIKCPECGAVHDLDDVEPVFMSDYFCEWYNLHFSVTYDMEYNGACIMIACGGPNIYVDTVSGNVELYWWNETGKARMTRQAVEAVDEYFSEVYACRRCDY